MAFSTFVQAGAGEDGAEAGVEGCVASASAAVDCNGRRGVGDVESCAALPRSSFECLRMSGGGDQGAEGSRMPRDEPELSKGPQREGVSGIDPDLGPKRA